MQVATLKKALENQPQFSKPFKKSQKNIPNGYIIYQLTKFGGLTGPNLENLVQRPILSKKSTFFEKKGTKNFTTPYSTPFVSVLYQNKALHNFQKRGQHLIGTCIKGLH